MCEVGKNSGRAKRLALDLFIAKNTSIQKIKIEDHEKVEQDQWLTFAIMYIFASTLKECGLPLGEFSAYATLNSELATLPLGRTLGQGTKVPSEILFGQSRKNKFFKMLQRGMKELKRALSSKEKLQEFMQGKIDFHNDPEGTVKMIFDKAGKVGARHANLRMCSLSLRITDDEPGKLRKLLEPFNEEDVNLTAIDSMPGVVTKEEEKKGIDPDRVVDFDLGIDLKTVTPDKAARILARLKEMGCVINYSGIPLKLV